MLGKPHETSFAQEFFTVKERFGLNSKQEGLDPTSGVTVSSVADPFCRLAIATDRSGLWSDLRGVDIFELIVDKVAS